MLTASNALTINCQYSSRLWTGGLNQVYTCNGWVTVDCNPEITAVTGTHASGMTNSDVVGFSLNYDAKVGYLQHYNLPSNLSSYFPNLRGIAWAGSKLDSIKATDLQPFPNLVNLNIGRNYLRQVDGDLLKFTPKLKVLLMSDNYIRKVGVGLFQGITQLTTFDFSLNPCIGNGEMIPAISKNYTIANLQADLERLCP